jgi:HSP20 family protein
MLLVLRKFSARSSVMAHAVVKVHRDKPTQPAETAHPVTRRLLRRLRTELDEAFDRVSRQIEEFPSLHPLHRIADFQWRLRHGMPLGSVAAAVDVVEEDKLFRISVELPGIEAKDVEVSVSDDSLVVKAKKKDAREEQAQSYYLREREYGSFERFIEMPVGVDQDKIDAHFANGVLTLELPKTPETIRKHKRIPVQGK